MDESRSPRRRKSRQPDPLGECRGSGPLAHFADVFLVTDKRWVADYRILPTHPIPDLGGRSQLKKVRPNEVGTATFLSQETGRLIERRLMEIHAAELFSNRVR